jgi:hypothetical protein
MWNTIVKSYYMEIFAYDRQTELVEGITYAACITVVGWEHFVPPGICDETKLVMIVKITSPSTLMNFWSVSNSGRHAYDMFTHYHKRASVQLSLQTFDLY